MASILVLENFDCTGDPNSVGVLWEKWKRAFELFLQASNISDPTKQRATLLHCGGLALQEIYYNLPGINTETVPDKTTDVYKNTILKLDEYFLPRSSRVFERHVFRLIKQEPQEKFDKFILRLRNQAAKCDFKNLEEHLIDQIAEKCTLSELRKKILTAGDSFSLEDIIKEANTLETVNRQLEEFTGKATLTEVNKLEAKKIQKSICSRCGSGKHTSEDKKCPARNRKCIKCGYVGHFREHCRTVRKRKWQQRDSENKDPKSKRRKDDKSEKDRSEEVDYVFHIDDDTMIDCIIGGVHTEMLIDSGSKCNLLTASTWEELKKRKIVVSNQEKSPKQVFMAYGSTKPLSVRGSFQADIAIGRKKTQATFYVIQGGTKNLLGKNTTITLGVLHLGTRVNAIETFPKFKDISVDIPIDKSVKPVAQPYRRIPIPLEEKVNKKIEELINQDIIEKVEGPSGYLQWYQS
ncbi:uncharacterized protein [Temnothorax nylanderi]|uniref:uncharacterized protein n=1 Tax=Temnothorax nylanderi TaxID=102681 RepID=UPI003A845642